MTHLEMLVIALVLDALLGEPSWLWSRFKHPAIVMGNAIGWADRQLNSGRARLLKGGLTIAVLALLAWVCGTLIAMIPDGGLLEILIAAMLLAQKSLMDHVSAVAQALRRGIAPARIAVGHIVGRKTQDLDDTGVARAAIESAAENFSDGVVAPAFWFAVFGAPGILVYKLVNTADSMIGYRNETYLLFGRAAARLDDILNWIPARMTGAAIVIIGRAKGAYEKMTKDAPLHRSPNAGWPEAAVAATLGIALSGPRQYGEAWTEDAYINEAGRRILDARDIEATVSLLWRVWAVLLAVIVVMALIMRAL